MISRLSIRATLSALIFSIGLVATVFAIISFWEASSASIESNTARLYAAVDRNLLVLQMGLLSEKADSPNVLRMSGDALAKARASMAENRQTVDKGYQAADALMADASDPSVLKAYGDVKSAMTDFLQARSAIDTALSSAKPQESSAGEAIGRAGNVLMERAINLAQMLETAMAESEPVLGDLGAIKRIAWQVRNVGGSVWEVAHGPYTGGPVLTPALIKKLDTIEGSTRSYWELLQSMSKSSTIPAPVKAAVDQARSEYFEGSFGTLRQSIVADVQAGKMPQMEFSVWLPKLIVAINTITNVAIVSMDQANIIAENAQYGAFRTAAISGVVGLAVLALWGLGYLVMKGRLFNPLELMTDAVRRLAKNDVAVDIPAFTRRDEMAELAGAVAVFKQNAIARMELEEKARQFQQELDRKLRETQAAFEAAGASQKAFLGTLATGLERLALGDLSTRIDKNSDPAFLTIQENFNGAIGRLEAALSAVLESANAVTDGVQEISQSTDSLARRTEQQAAALEQTAAALEEITANVGSSAGRSSEARTVAVNAVSNATKSGSVVAEAVAAMRRIEEASAKVRNIITVIDEIAFQTNLLALNAGVEAARAGEAGKGFAVVAQEVRELAQRSASASKEIRDLIQRSNQEIGEGVKLVAETGEALHTIEHDIATINDHMEAIAVSSSEQAAGISQVNTAVNQMDHATQQNAAMVEESNAAASLLAQEANKLRQAMRGFRIGEGSSTYGMRNATRAA